MNKILFKGALLLLSVSVSGVFGVSAYTTIDGSTNDHNTDTIRDIDRGDVDTAVTSTCVDLKSDNLRYRATDAITGGEVSLLQDFLIAGGFLKTQATGYFGLGTFSAVKAYQKSVGLSPTGYVGPLTKAKIKGSSCFMGQNTEAIPKTSSDSIRIGLPKVVACTMEARLCDDGSMMPRNMENCQWLPAKCPTGTGSATLRSLSPGIISQPVSPQNQQKTYSCERKKAVCDTSASTYNSLACKETTALCDGLSGVAPAFSANPPQTPPATTTRFFQAECLYAAPPTGCNYVPGPNYVPGSSCGMVLSCPNGVSSTTLRDSNPGSMCVAGSERCGDVVMPTGTLKITNPPMPPVQVCTDVVRYCLPGTLPKSTDVCPCIPRTGGVDTVIFQQSGI